MNITKNDLYKEFECRDGHKAVLYRISTEEEVNNNFTPFFFIKFDGTDDRDDTIFGALGSGKTYRNEDEIIGYWRDRRSFNIEVKFKEQSNLIDDNKEKITAMKLQLASICRQIDFLSKKLESIESKMEFLRGKQ